MNNLDVTQIWAVVAWVFSAILLILNCAEKIVAAVKVAKAPNDKQNERLEILEDRADNYDARLQRGDAHFAAIDEGNRVTQRALLALLAHGIDGNNTEQMKDAKKALETHLINR